MADITYSGVLKYVQDDNITTILPKTNAENVNGLNDLIAEAKSYSTAVDSTGTGTVYAVTVPGITSLTRGITLTFIPNTNSLTPNCYLNVNNLGNKYIRRTVTGDQTRCISGNRDAWIWKDIPVTVMYDGTYWRVNNPKPDANDIKGIVPISYGGTGVSGHADTVYTTPRYRASALFNADTNPTVNGVINWTYK